MGRGSAQFLAAVDSPPSREEEDRIDGSLKRAFQPTLDRPITIEKAADDPSHRMSIDNREILERPSGLCTDCLMQ
jgi:hypothetical protein